MPPVDEQASKVLKVVTSDVTSGHQAGRFALSDAAANAMSSIRAEQWNGACGSCGSCKLQFEELIWLWAGAGEKAA